MKREVGIILTATVIAGLIAIELFGVVYGGAE